MLKRIKSNIVILLLLVVFNGCSALSVPAPDALLKTCAAHFDTKIVSEFKNEQVSGVPSITFIYKTNLPPEISKEINCLVLEVDKQYKDTEALLINVFNDRTKALVSVALDRKNGAFIITELSQAPSLPDGQVLGTLVVMVPLENMLKALAGDKDAFVIPIRSGQGLIPLAEYKKMLAELTGGKVTF